MHSALPASSSPQTRCRKACHIILPCARVRTLPQHRGLCCAALHSQACVDRYRECTVRTMLGRYAAVAFASAPPNGASSVKRRYALHLCPVAPRIGQG